MGALLDLDFERFLAGITECCEPMDFDSELLNAVSVESVVLGGHEHSFLAKAVSHSLRERDLEFASVGAFVVLVTDLVHVFTTDADGNPVRSIAAQLAKHEDGTPVYVGVERPLNNVLLGTLLSLSRNERIRVGTEFVRVLSDLVRLRCLSKSIRGNVVGGLRNLVRLLRFTVRDTGNNNAGRAGQKGRSRADVSADDLRFHVSDSMAVVPTRH